jgi:hypothetical protein
MKILISETQLKSIIKESINNNILLEAKIDLETIKKKYVDDKDTQVVSIKEFDEILKVTDNNPNLVVWMITRIKNGIILKEDIYKYEMYFKIYEKYKKRFEFKDINQYKTKESISNFRNTCIDIIDELESTKQGSTEGSKADIERRRQNELSGVISGESTEENRRPNGSIGTQGFDPTQMKNLITFLNDKLKLNIDEKLFESEKLKPIIDFIKNNKDIVEKIKEYVKTDPIEISRMPDGSLSFRDGNHRANLLNLIGSDILPTIEVGQRNKIDEINAKYDAELAALEGKAPEESLTIEDESQV